MSSQSASASPVAPDIYVAVAAQESASCEMVFKIKEDTEQKDRNSSGVVHVEEVDYSDTVTGLLPAYCVEYLRENADLCPLCRKNSTGTLRLLVRHEKGAPHVITVHTLFDSPSSAHDQVNMRLSHLSSDLCVVIMMASPLVSYCGRPARPNTYT